MNNTKRDLMNNQIRSRAKLQKKPASQLRKTVSSGPNLIERMMLQNKLKQT